MMNMVNEMNAYRFSDNYQIVALDTENCVGCEHNQQEAQTIADYLTNYHGHKYAVVANGPDKVRASKQFRSTPFRFQHRELVLREMGVWPDTPSGMKYTRTEMLDGKPVRCFIENK